MAIEKLASKASAAKTQYGGLDCFAASGGSQGRSGITDSGVFKIAVRKTRPQDPPDA